MQSQDERTLFENSGTLEHRTRTYSMAATAAGVSLLALVAPAEGKVVITTHINIQVTSTVTLDLNHDGVPDVKFIRCGYHDGGFSCSNLPLGAYSTRLSATGLNGGGILNSKQTGALNLARSAPIGKSGYFGKYAFMAERFGTAYTTATPEGNWGTGQPNRFLGVKLSIHGTTHYGWVRITVKNPKTKGPLTATITEYGYETIANKKVLAGVPSNNAAIAADADARTAGATLGMLAWGVDGLPAWRREEFDSTAR